MHIYLGSDHGGFALKQICFSALKSEGHEITDCGAFALDPADDYPQFAQAVAEKVLADPESLGILLCRSGEGMAMAANRFRGIRAAVIWQDAVARETREDNNANIAVLPADFLDEKQALQCVHHFITTAFSGEARHIRRLEALEKIYGS